MSAQPQPYAWATLEKAAETPVWITDDERLRECTEYWLTLPMVALDTEFMRVSTYYPIPGLIQLADDHHCYLIDPLEVSDFSPLVEVLKSPDVIKIVHAGSEDLELFQHSYGVLPEPLFDTQVAAAFAGWGFSMGLQRLVQHALGIELGKGETTSDWLQRPLTPQQIRYAALDVAYLPDIATQLQMELKQAGRLEWVFEECAEQRLNVIDTDPEGVNYYRRFSQVWNISPVKRAALRDLTAWREREARARDVPRNRLLRNQQLLQIIERWPTQVSDLERIPELRRRVVREDGETIVSFVRHAPHSAEIEPPAPIDRPLHYSWNKRIKALKALGRQVSEREHITIEVLLRKRDLDALIQSRDDQGQYQLPRTLSGWRRALVGDLLLNRLQQFESE